MAHAKIIDKKDLPKLLEALKDERERVMVLLSLKAGPGFAPSRSPS